MNILDEILAYKKTEVEQRKILLSEANIRKQISSLPDTRGFLSSINRTLAAGQASIIAEIKKASPSKGIIRSDFHPAELARSYELGGASCLSVLTDEKYFQGHDSFLQQARNAVKLPVIRKDFIVDAYQIYESRLMGADAILLIAAALSEGELVEFYKIAIALSLDVLVEVHNESELKTVLRMGAGLIGVNNRNLKTFVTDLNTSIRLRALIPDNQVMVAESGIGTVEDINHLENNGVHVFLVGESLMREPDPCIALKHLLGTDQEHNL